MRKISITMLSSSLIVLTILLAYTLIAGNFGERVTVYSAPTLLGPAEEAAHLYGVGRVDIRVLGSVMGARLIQSGRLPDVFLSVDWELLKTVHPRRLLDLGSFKLQLVCREGHSVESLRHVRIGVANPNTAPIGYRALAALYWLSVTYNVTDVDEIEQGLNVKFIEDTVKREIKIDVRGFGAAGRFFMRDDLSGVGALLEGGMVDCIFAHSPFIVSRNYSHRFEVMDLPREIEFLDNPPIKFTAITEFGDIEVRGFRAFAASFTRSGDEYLDRLVNVNLSKYGLTVGDG